MDSELHIRLLRLRRFSEPPAAPSKARRTRQMDQPAQAAHTNCPFGLACVSTVACGRCVLRIGFHNCLPKQIDESWPKKRSKLAVASRSRRGGWQRTSDSAWKRLLFQFEWHTPTQRIPPMGLRTTTRTALVRLRDLEQLGYRGVAQCSQAHHQPHRRIENFTVAPRTPRFLCAPEFPTNPRIPPSFRVTA